MIRKTLLLFCLLISLSLVACAEWREGAQRLDPSFADIVYFSYHNLSISEEPIIVDVTDSEDIKELKKIFTGIAFDEGVPVASIFHGLSVNFYDQSRSLSLVVGIATSGDFARVDGPGYVYYDISNRNQKELLRIMDKYNVPLITL